MADRGSFIRSHRDHDVHCRSGPGDREVDQQRWRSRFSDRTVALLIVLPFLNVWRGTLREYHPLRLVAPPLTLFSLSVFSKMTFGALTGFEYIAVFAGECRDPARHLPRSVLHHRAHHRARLHFGDQRDPGIRAALIGGRSRAQWLRRSAAVFSRSGLAVCDRSRRACSSSSTIWRLSALSSASAPDCPWLRDGITLLPEWFSQLHPRYKTPINSVLFWGRRLSSSPCSPWSGWGMRNRMSSADVELHLLRNRLPCAVRDSDLFREKIAAYERLSGSAWLRVPECS